jgi:hypothetical protein
MKGVKGPLFVSIGDQKKLETFLELNPEIPRDTVFGDDYDFQAYNAVGFGKFTDLSEKDKKDITMRKPEISLKTWWKYLTNVIKLSPIDRDNPGIPEGVLRLGGTFVIQGDDVVYQWNDKIPGDHPEPEDVLRFIEEKMTIDA